MKELNINFRFILFVILVGFNLSQTKAQYTLHNSPMLEIMAIDSFHVEYTLGNRHDSGIIKIDTFTLTKYDSFLSYHTRDLDVITNGKHSMLVQHASKRMVFGPKAPKFFDQYIQIQLKDTNQIYSIDSTDTISGFRIYTVIYDSLPSIPHRSKIIKLNVQTGFADEIILKTIDSKGEKTISYFNLLILQVNGSILPPLSVNEFLITGGPPKGWQKKPQYFSYRLINYY